MVTRKRGQKKRGPRPVVGAKTAVPPCFRAPCGPCSMRRPAATRQDCADLNAVSRSAISCGLLRGVVRTCARAGSQPTTRFPVPPLRPTLPFAAFAPVFAIDNSTHAGKLQVESAIFNPCARIRRARRRTGVGAVADGVGICVLAVPCGFWGSVLPLPCGLSWRRSCAAFGCGSSRVAASGGQGGPGGLRFPPRPSLDSPLPLETPPLR